MVSVCLPSDADALLQHLLFAWVSLPWMWGISSWVLRKVQPLLLTLDEGYLLTATPPDLQCGIAPLGPPVPVQPLLLGGGVAPLGCHNPMDYTVHEILQVRVLEWVAFPFSSGPHSVRPLHHDPPVLGGPMGMA